MLYLIDKLLSEHLSREIEQYASYTLYIILQQVQTIRELGRRRDIIYMKKVFLVALMAIGSTMAFAQSGKWAAGVNVGYGSDIKKPAIGFKVSYDISDKFTLAPSFNYYFKKTEDFYEYGVSEEVTSKFWDINCDLHWNVLSADNYRVYPFAGITYLHGKAEATASDYGFAEVTDGKVGANVGVGGQLDVVSNLAVGAEVKYQIIDGSQVVPSLSIMYKF